MKLSTDPIIAKAKNEWSYTSTPAHSFIKFTGIFNFPQLALRSLMYLDYFRRSTLPAVRMWREIRGLRHLLQCNELCFAKWIEVVRDADGMTNNESLVNKKPFSECLNMLNKWPLVHSRANIQVDKVYTLKCIALFFHIYGQTAALLCEECVNNRRKSNQGL
jgi:hypothetical protein